MIINISAIFCLFSFLFSSDILDINHLSDDLFSDFIYIDLESHNKTGYLFDKNNPDIMREFEYMNFKIDGSMMYPIISSIPKQIFFNKSDTLSMSQLSIVQDHSNKYYDTSVALKTHLNNRLNNITQIESKSIYGNNYNQKFITSFYRNIDNLEFDVGYMYNKEDILTYRESGNSSFSRGIESFSSKLYVKYIGIPNLIISNQFNDQISNYNRFWDDNYNEYLSKTDWNQLLISYRFGITQLEFQSNYKKTVSDVMGNHISTYFAGNYHHLSLVSKSFFGNHYFLIGIDNYTTGNPGPDVGDNNYYSFNYLFNWRDFSFGVNLDNDVFIKIYGSEMNHIISKTSNIRIGYKNTNFMHNIIIGQKDRNSDLNNFIADYSSPYYYYLYETGIQYDWFKLHFNYSNFDASDLYIKSNMSLDIMLSPILENKRYRPYFRFKISNLGVNNNYSISHEELEFISDENSSISDITVVDGEFGFLFNDFKISFIKENILDEYLYYAEDIYFYNTSKYLINITWLFKD